MGQIVSDILVILKAVSLLGKENGEGVNLEWENIRFEMWGITSQEFYEAALQNLKKVEPNVLCLGDPQEQSSISWEYLNGKIRLMNEGDRI